MDIVRVTRDLTALQVEQSYRRGEFPMATDRVITWHHPPVRAIIDPTRFHISRSLARTLRRGAFDVTVNRDFIGVMRGCADRDETWIDERIYRVFGELHRDRKAHSLEVRVDGELAGGVYGVALGGAFFAESMFHRVTDMSKVALAKLCERLIERRFALLDVQYLTDHLESLGAEEIPASEYQRRLEHALTLERQFA